jgi:L-alanine-DL-glutamate epimerase-like enolase superfamily enzyme
MRRFVRGNEEFEEKAMRIHDIQAIGLTGATPEGGWSNELRPEDSVHTLILVQTTEGLTGVGSVFTNAGLVQAALAILEPLYRGENALEPERVSEKLHQHTFWLGRGGSLTHTISGIDIALWDILGQSLGVPVWQLLGGRRAERMPAYASGGWADAKHIGEQLNGYVARGGFGAVKMRIGVFDGSPAASAERVHAARAALPAGVGLMVDAHGTFTVSEARQFCHLVRDCDLAWFEEPVTADDKAGLAEVRRSTHIPIASGESDATRFEFRELIDLRAADILQPDLAICGGITEAMRIGALASAANLRIAPHLWAGAPAFAAGLHVAAACPAAFILEYSLGANPMIHELVEESFGVEDGMLAIPDRPGLGITVRDDFVQRHRKR